MSNYDFFVRYIRFVASKTPRDTIGVEAMMQELGRIATGIENTGTFRVEGDKLEIAARALAGLAGLLQQKILPEVVAAGNPHNETQVRWVIDTSMALMANLTVRADAGDHDPSEVITLPEPPA
jgi:hypothetical protein